MRAPKLAAHLLLGPHCPTQSPATPRIAFCFMGKETEAQRDVAPCPRQHSSIALAHSCADCVTNEP